MGSDAWFSFARTTTISWVVLALASCTTSSTPKAPPEASSAPTAVNPVDVASVEASTILTSEQIAKVEWPPCCTAETVLDGSARHRDNDREFMQRQLAATERRLGVPVLQQDCAPGRPDAYAVVTIDFTSWDDSEDFIAVRAGEGSAPAQVTRVDRISPDFIKKTRRRELSRTEWTALARGFEEIGVRRFPADLDGGAACMHAPVYAFESCLDGAYRVTYDYCPSGFEPEEARVGSAFYRASVLLDDLIPAPPQD